MNDEIIQIWCMGCRKKNEIQEAINSGWKYCKSCHYFICPECLSIIKLKDNLCLSWKCRQHNNPIEISEIPVLDILNYSRNNINTLPLDSLIYKLFFQKFGEFNLKKPIAF